MTATAPLSGNPLSDDPRFAARADQLRWVHDPDDDRRCLLSLSAVHDVAAGRMVCHPTPGATTLVLVRDLLAALGVGKRRDGLARARRTGDGVALVRVWLRAEQIEHLVVLRAHRLHPPLIGLLADLAVGTGAVAWLVWHDPEPPIASHPGEVWGWPAAVTAIRHDRPPNKAPRLYPAERIYRETVAEARREARLWRVAPPRQRRFTHPGCELGALLQRLTIDATNPAEREVRISAAMAGFATEGLALIIPADATAVGPRLTAAVLDRLRRITCPTLATALLLALVTDAGAGSVAFVRPRSISPDAGQVRLLSGTYRIPERARPVLRAAVLDHQARRLPAYLLLAGRDGRLFPTRAMSHRIAQAAHTTGVPLPHAATPAGRSSTLLETPFAAALITNGARIIGAEPPPRLRPRSSARH